MSRLSSDRLERGGVLSMIRAAPAAVLPVDVAGLDHIEDSLYELETGIGALKEVLSARISEEHLSFIASALTDALSQRLTSCFDALEAGDLLRAQRRLIEA
jgi:hypothetical protein